MRIVVLGAGAIGSLFGGILAQKHDVTLVCRQDHARAVEKNGLKITGLSNIHSRPKAATSVDGLDSPEIVFLTVKSYDTTKAVAQALKIVSDGTILVSLQNGLGNRETMTENMPDEWFVMGITSQGAILRSPGNVEHTGKSYTMVGGHKAGRIAELLSGSGIETTVSENIIQEIWYKAMVNSVINPIATLVKERNGVIREKRFEELARNIVAEGVAVAGARGIPMDEGIAWEKVMKVANETENNICSMRLDVEKGRKTEIAQMNGAIARYGAESGVPTPVNELLAALISALEPKQQ